jgi:hypothetical protein
MAACKDCLHAEVCEDITRHKLSPERAKELLPILRNSGKICDHFKDRSRFVELPANGIMYGIIDGRVTELLNLIIQPGDSGMCVLSPDNINKTIFSTKEQAEQALKEHET